jgi:hypothetical protein
VTRPLPKVFNEREEREDSEQEVTRIPAFDVSVFARASDSERVLGEPDPMEVALRARLGPLSYVPFVLPRPAALASMIANHQEAFMVSLVDGHSSLQAIIDACGLPELDAVRLLADLVQRAILGLREKK